MESTDDIFVGIEVVSIIFAKAALNRFSVYAFCFLIIPVPSAYNPVIHFL